MNKKKYVLYVLLMILYATASVSFAQTVEIGDCGEICQGHVLAGSDTICVSAGKHEIRLDGVNIDVSDQDGVAAFEIKRDAEVILTLANENVLKSGAGCAGIQVPYRAMLTITEQSTGQLEAFGGPDGAGIGGGRDQDCGTIRIMGGFVNATGGEGDGYIGDYESGAGIGGGYLGDGGEITITGGVIEAYSGPGGAGIGGGYDGNGGEITITGGLIDAGSDGAGAGIGGGAGGEGGIILIEGGYIGAGNGYWAEYPSGGAGIGGGSGGNGGDITIRGGIIFGGSGIGGAGIGAGSGAYSKKIRIESGVISASGGEWGGVGIGGGKDLDEWYDEIIEITGGVITAEGGYTQYSDPSGAGIGGSGGNINPTIRIEGGYIYAIAGRSGNYGGAGIGSGGGANADTILIEGGRIYAHAGTEEDVWYGGAAIGSGGGGTVGDILILGGTITADGHGRGAGIGSGERHDTRIQIDGGIVMADSVNVNGIDEGYEHANGTLITNGEMTKPNTESMEYMFDPEWLRRR